MKRSEVVGILILVVMVLAITAVTMLGNRKEYSAIESQTAVEQKTTNTLFTFDPNTVTYEELLALGFEKQTAVSLLKYRSRGKVFEIAEELALCYGVTDSMFKALRPYITIGEEFKPKPIVYHSKTTAKSDSLRTVRQQQWEAKISKRTPHPKERFRIDTVGIAYLQSIGFTYRQAEGLIEYRDSGAEGIRNMAELSDCWAVSVEMADSLARYIIFPEPKPHNGKIEINSADSATLRKVRGIGEKTVVAVMEYRKLLGGFVRKEQISELKCVTSE
ncbi:MAG: helix-hairpin-helix domain-containing protein, partial [Alistipes sp.]|nr:helix-hairpin-helix domain-containing protein [Alistipes sp.]